MASRRRTNPSRFYGFSGANAIGTGESRSSSSLWALPRPRQTSAPSPRTTRAAIVADEPRWPPLALSGIVPR
jgi:hypothetical protein